MAGRRIADMLVRLWRLVEVLQGRRYGASAQKLAELAETSRSTVYRYLRTLEDAGVPLAKERVNGEVRYSLRRDALPPLGPGSAGRIALAVARQMITPLDGTRAAGELDACLAALGVDHARPLVSARRARPAHDPRVAAAVERALESKHQLEMRYRAASTGRTERRVVDPAALRIDGAHAYLVAWDHRRDAWRTFKLSRVVDAKPLSASAGPHPAYDESELFGHAVRAWHAAPVDVRVRLAPEVAAIASEYPLVADQRLLPQPDGSILVEARVAGITETTRWVLAWGAAAEALSPPELRAAVETELAAAIARYRKPGVRKSREQVVSRKVGRGRGIRGGERKVVSSETAGGGG